MNKPPLARRVVHHDAASAAPSPRELERFRALIREACGIEWGDSKQELLSSRIERRVRVGGFGSFAEYYAHVVNDRTGRERIALINAVTTNKTAFFREPHHFEYLRQQILPERQRAARDPRPRLRLWSAGCSTGEEAYSIAFTALAALGAGWDLRVYATDIDTEVLERAKRAVYSEESARAVPPELRGRYFEPLPGGCVRVREDVRRLVHFSRSNIVGTDWPAERFDVIFCRNVVIYFAPETRRSIFERLTERLLPNSYLIIGHSESLNGAGSRFASVATTVYRLERPRRRRVMPPTE